MKIIGHKKQLTHLEYLVSRSELPHALLLTGPMGIGKKQVALHLVQRLFCQVAKGPLPCDTCSSCQRVATLTHPDLLWIEPEENIIKIEAIRNLKSTLSLQPLEAPFKIVILVDAHHLNQAASNAFLKTLEEPPSHTLIFLISSEPHRLPKTILSRCQKLYFSPLNLNETQEILKEKNPERSYSQEMIQEGGGSPGLVLSIPEEAYRQVNEILLPALESQPKDLFGLFGAAEEIGQDEKLQKGVLYLLLMKWKDKILKDPSSEDIKKFDFIQNSLQALDHHANPLLTFETLFLNLCL